MNHFSRKSSSISLFRTRTFWVRIMRMRITSNRVAVTLIMRLLLLFMACGLYPVSIAQGVTIGVPAAQPTIQAAINAATSGDIIVVAPGTYLETIDFLGKEVTLRSSAGPSSTIIDGLESIGSMVQCVNGEGAGTILEGFTITRGNAETGGGMLNIDSSPTIINCIFTDNHAGDRGGGMYNHKGDPTVIASTFDGNTAVEMGGGMFNLRASPMVTRCLFTQNSSNKGAGMRNYLNSHPTVTNSIFSDNQAGEEGGGMDNRKNSNAVVTGCVFDGNTAGSGGGGMHNYVGRAKATGNPIIINCLFIGNSAPTGAGMRNNDPDPTIINTTIAYNDGSGISSRNGSAPIIENSIVWGNSGGSFSGASSSSSIVSYSDIEGGFDGMENLNVDPMFVSPAGNDYHLSVDSPLINAGNNSAPHLTEFDLEGNPRIIGVTVDMGAYESDGSCSEVDNDGDTYTACDGDCNDNDPDINPEATEICDGIDNNCNGTIDEGFDNDNDGYTTCGGDGDCDDSAPGINPGAVEICDDDLDNDCDGDIDTADSDCGGEPLLPKGATCTQDNECVSNKCKGRSGNMTCK
jgi:hypothetical protein